MLNITSILTAITLLMLPVINVPVAVAQSFTQQSQNTLVNKDNTLKFDLQGCQRENQQVICDLLITSLIDEKRDLQIYAKSRVLDFSGSEYISKGVRFSNERPAESAEKALIQGVSMKASIFFEIPSHVNNLAALDIYYWFGYQTSIALRNIAIQPKRR